MGIHCSEAARQPKRDALPTQDGRATERRGPLTLYCPLEGLPQGLQLAAQLCQGSQRAAVVTTAPPPIVIVIPVCGTRARRRRAGRQAAACAQPKPARAVQQCRPRTQAPRRQRHTACKQTYRHDAMMKRQAGQLPGARQTTRLRNSSHCRCRPLTLPTPTLGGAMPSSKPAHKAWDHCPCPCQGACPFGDQSALNGLAWPPGGCMVMVQVRTVRQ